MIKQIKIIQNEFAGLVPSSIVAHNLFNGNHKKAIEYLDSLVQDGKMKKLNKNDHNQYYRFYNEYENGILNHKNITIDNITNDIFDGDKEIAIEYLNSFEKNGLLKYISNNSYKLING